MPKIATRPQAIQSQGNYHPMSPMKNQENTMLKEILEQMLKNAKANPNQEQAKKLKGNLHIYLIWTEPFYSFSIARDGTPPSIVEMKTCLGCLPANIHKPAIEEAHPTLQHGHEALSITFAETQYIQPMFE